MSLPLMVYIYIRTQAEKRFNRSLIYYLFSLDSESLNSCARMG